MIYVVWDISKIKRIKNEIDNIVDINGKIQTRKLAWPSCVFYSKFVDFEMKDNLQYIKRKTLVWCLPQNLRCLSQYLEKGKSKHEVGRKTYIHPAQGGLDHSIGEENIWG